MQLLSRLTSSQLPCAVGLDLSAHGLCWVELRLDQGSGLVLERCLFEALPPGCIIDGQIAEFQEVESALARLTLLAEPVQMPDARQAVSLALSVPAGLVTSHRTRFAGKLPEAALAERAQAEVSSLLRRSPDELSVDFQFSFTSSPSSPDPGTELVVAAVPKDAVEDRIALIEGLSGGAQGKTGIGLRLRPVSVAMASQMAVLAACRAARVSSARPNAPVALIQVDTQGLQLDIVLQTGALSSERFVLAASLASERLSLGSPVEPPAALLQAIDAARPFQLWVTGFNPEAAAWAVVLQERTGLSCAMVDPFAAMVRGRAFSGQVLPDASRALVACGLALTALGQAGRFISSSRPVPSLFPVCFNFLPHREIASARREKSILMQMGAVALSALLVSAVLRLALSDKLASGGAAQAELLRAAVGLDAEVRRQAVVAADVQLLRRHEAVLISFAHKRDQTAQMLRELGELLPEGLHLTSFRIDQGGDAILSGQARSAAEVFALMGRLSADSQHFKRAALLDLSLPADLGSALMAQPAASSAVSPPPLVSSRPGELAERVVFTIRTQP